MLEFVRKYTSIDRYAEDVQLSSLAVAFSIKKCMTPANGDRLPASRVLDKRSNAEDRNVIHAYYLKSLLDNNVPEEIFYKFTLDFCKDDNDCIFEEYEARRRSTLAMMLCSAL